MYLCIRYLRTCLHVYMCTDCVYMYVRKRSCIHVCVHMSVHPSFQPQIHTRTSTYLAKTYVQTYPNIKISIYIHTYIHSYLCVSVCLFVSPFMSVYVYVIKTHPDMLKKMPKLYERMNTSWYKPGEMDERQSNWIFCYKKKVTELVNHSC